MASKTPKLQMQDSEVAAFRWVPLKTLVPEAVTGIRFFGKEWWDLKGRNLEKYISLTMQGCAKTGISPIILF